MSNNPIMRIRSIAFSLLFGTASFAQQVDWLIGPSVGWTLNPAMARHEIASAPGNLVAMRMVDVSLVYGSTVYGSVALDALDPATGSTWLSCLLTDSVSIGAVAVDPAGIAYFTGRFTGDVLEFCDGSQLPGIGGFLTENHFLMAWNLNTGMPLWSRNLSVSHPNGTEVASIALDSNGDLWYIIRDFFDGQVIRVDVAGNDVEARDIQGVRRFGTISFDPWGGLYVSGSCENGTLTFGGQGFPVSSPDGYNMFVLRFKPDGTAGFAEFGLDFTFTAPMVLATSDGHAYLAGELNLDGPVWDGLLFDGTNWGADVFIARLDSTGQFLWGLEAHPNGGGITGDVEPAHGRCIALDLGGNLYFTGSTRGIVDWGNGVMSGGPVITERRLTVMAIDPSGVPQWAISSEPADWFVTAQSITAQVEVDALHVAAHASGVFTFGPHTVNGGGGQAAVFGRIGGLSTRVNEFPSTPGAMHAWPNPMQDMLGVDVDTSVTIPAELLTLTGQRVRSFTLAPGRNIVAVGDLSPGVYLLSAGGGKVVKVVKE